MTTIFLLIATSPDVDDEDFLVDVDAFIVNVNQKTVTISGQINAVVTKINRYSNKFYVHTGRCAGDNGL